MNLADYLVRAAAGHPDRPALVFAGPPGAGGARVDRVLTFAELDLCSARLAGGLAGLGLGPGSRVIVLAPLSPTLYGALIALLRLGATAVFLDPHSGRAGLEAAATLAAADALIGTRLVQALRQLSPVLRRVPLALGVDDRGSLGWLAQHGPPRPALCEVDSDHPALVTFTSGSTGGTGTAGARGVVRSHGQLAAQHEAIAAALPTEPNDIDLVTFPVLVLHNLATGLPSVLPAAVPGRPGRRSASASVDAIRRWHCSTAAGTPAFWETVVTHCLTEGGRLPLRRIVTGGAPLGMRLLDRLAEIAPDAEVVSVYGSSEVEPVATIGGEALGRLAEQSAGGAGAVLGRPVPQARVRIVDAHGTDVPEGHPGELWVSGPHVAPSDFGSPDGAGPHKHRAPDGTVWHAMGDLGYRDEAGRLWLVGRTHTVILRDPQPCYPVPIEAAVEALPFVARAAVVTIPVLEPPGEHTVLAVQMGGSPPPRDWPEQVRGVAESLRPLPGAGPAGLDEVRRLRAIPLDARHRARVDDRALRRRLIDAHWGRHVAAYLGERFPPLPHGLLIASYFAANALLAEASTAPSGPLALSWRLVAGAVVTFLMFFHLRVVDEHKDQAQDRVVHPERLLSRGLVTLPQLARLGAVAIGLELALSWALGPAALLGCLVILGVSALIAQGFFLGPRLEDHVLANAFVHLIIMPAYGLFAFSVATGRPLWAAPAPVLLYSWVGYAVGLAYELARKTRAPEEERPGLVTYSRALGPHRPATLALGAIAAAAGLSWVVGSLLALGPWYHLAVLGLLALVAVGVLDFRRHTTPARAARLKGYAGLYIFAFDVLLSIELIRVYGVHWS